MIALLFKPANTNKVCLTLKAENKTEGCILKEMMAKISFFRITGYSVTDEKSCEANLTEWNPDSWEI